ncbi:glycosyl hydrolase [Nibricoccus aquaticus]|uniref:Glycosyl hydrolase n=1 Tax=Nibricoccus aquaticus TaxID=2576891 RepID=A0A290Q1I5_9BACT|nr:DUF1080 domain-containing protein [Nibricoccus aquaticus]ATC62515.1 glycosyl hydrolase [Nibricoccus aquaticus]
MIRLTLVALFSGWVVTLFAQQPAVPYAPKQSDRPVALTEEEPGFQPIFDGKTLNGWEGNKTYWRVEDGAIVGEITPETLMKSNTFLVWQGGRPKDFELRLECRISERGNSGINYRSVMAEDKVTPANAFAMRGPQLDIDGRKQYFGGNYEEKGRLFLGVRGGVSRVTGGRPPTLLARTGEEAELAQAITDGWNSVHLIARGNVFTHIINGRVMCVVIDDDEANHPVEGFIGVQVHSGPPMKVEYRNVRLKTF